MANFNDYDDLKNIIIRWVDNTDAAAEIDIAVDLTHTELNRVVRLGETTKLAYINTEAGNPWVTRPYITDPQEYMGMRRLKINDDRTPALVYQTLSQIDQITPTPQGRPSWYTVVGERIRLARVPDAVYQLEAAFYQKVPVLQDVGATTNAFLEECSDLLLYGSLKRLEMYIKDPEQALHWSQMYDSGLGDLKLAIERRKYPDGQLAISTV